MLVQHADEVISSLGDSQLLTTQTDLITDAHAASDQINQVAIPNIYSGPALDYNMRETARGSDMMLQKAIRPGMQLKMTAISGFVRGRPTDITSPRGKTDLGRQAVSLAVTHVDKQAKKKPLSRLLPKEDLKDLEAKFERLLGRNKARADSPNGRLSQTIEATSMGAVT